MLVDLQTFPKTKMKKVYCDDDENDANKGYGFCEINNEMRYDTQKDDESTAAGAASMAAYDPVNSPLSKLPFSVTMSLMNTLDPDRGWESVAAAAGFTFDRIQQLAFKLTQNASPTRTLLWELGNLNYTVNDLYETLKLANRLREMQTLEAYIKEGGMKVAAVKPKSPPSSLSSLLSQIKESDQRSQGRPGLSSMSGSEHNFNKPSPVDKSRVIQSKNYGDKIIPGTFSSPSCPLKEANVNITRSVSSDHRMDLPTMLLRTEGYKSLPQYYLPSSQQQVVAEGSRTEGVENIPLSGHSFPTSSGNKSTLPHCGASSSLNSEHKLDASASSSQLDNTEKKVSFSYRELFNATDGFHQNKILGEGAFGNVYKGTLNQQECAIKRLYSSTTNSKKSDQVKSELAALHKFQHENIVTLYGYAENGSELCLVYQYMANGSLEDRLLHKNDTPSLTWERRLNILRGSCMGLNFLHTMGDPPLIHGDVKSANILLDQYFEAKLGDFGQAKYATRSSSTDTSGFTHITVAETTTKLFGTKAYLAPELVSNGIQSVKSDIYALGVVFMEVCSGLKAYDQSRNVGTFLIDYFRNEVADKAEGVWNEHFQDRTLHDVSEDTFIGVLKLALKCVNTAKKARPDTKKLLSELKVMYTHHQERNGGHPVSQLSHDETSSSISTSLQIDSRNTENSGYLTSTIESQLGGSASEACGPDQQMKIRRELLQFQPPPPKLPEQLRTPIHEPQLQKQPDFPAVFSANHTQMNAELRDHPSADNPSKSFPPSVPQSVPFLLQAAYDQQPKRKIIDRLSGVLQKDEEHDVEEYPSDPQKLQKIDKFDNEQQNNMPSHCTVFQNGNPEADNFPQADPKKLALLKAYDEASFGAEDHSAGDPTCLDCDPHKMAYLQTFDNLYKQPAEKQIYSNTLQTAVAESRQELSDQKDILMNRFHLSDVQAGFPCTTASSGLTCVPQNLPHYTSQLISENYVEYARPGKASPGPEQREDIRYTAKHAGNGWPSGYVNVVNGWPQDRQEVAVAQTNVSKQKMDQLFYMYNQLQCADDEDDDDNGCGNEEEEANI